MGGMGCGDGLTDGKLAEVVNCQEEVAVTACLGHWDNVHCKNVPRVVGPDGGEGGANCCGRVSIPQAEFALDQLLEHGLSEMGPVEAAA